MIYQNAIANLQRYVGEAFKAGTATFPHYTLHGLEHLEELDRLAILVGTAIPSLTEERLGLLRLAIAVHDFAMVDIPGEDREKELRRRLGDAIPLPDLVRKTHQDEIECCFTQPERIALLMGLIPGATPGLLGDVATIARHHRLHPLDQAPRHLRDLCALMRILDELDIGPRRAPATAYEALRSRMDTNAKIHWLKHLCTRPIESYTTFSVDLMKGPGRVLRLFVAVNATQTTWEPLQGIVIGKLKSCLEEELVNQVLREMLQVEFQVDPSLDPPSGPTPWLPNVLRDDLDNLPLDLLRPHERGSTQPTVESTALLSAPLPRQPPAVSAPRSSREFKVIAVPPERLAEFLCNSGRLTVISNAYVVPEEETIGGVPGAASRFFVGPADSGKTRAALEWLKRVIGPAHSQWVIFRTDVGTLPNDASAIVLDRSLYEEIPLPTKAILFLDDLPTNLPTQGDDVLSAEETLRGFFRWFRELPFLRERRVIGTMRLEDVHSRPDWPDVLPSLGQELELIRLHPLDEQRYRKLWEGMGVGEVSRSMTRGIESFEIELTSEFLGAVIERNADPEAVATFVQQNALKSKTVLSSEDAGTFSESAVETWLRETWPAVQQAYGVAARVFFSLARFVEAGLRPMSGYPSSMGPQWAYHERWGPELCDLQGGAAGTYLPILEKLIADGHAAGEPGVRIRPKLDFLLQADNLPGVELSISDLDWYVQRSNGLEGSDRMAMAQQFSSLDMEGPSSQDADLLRGWGIGSLQSSVRPENKTRQSALLDRSIINLKKALQLDSNDSLTWSNLAVSLLRKADQENNRRKSDELLDEAMAACRSATQTDSQNSQGWNCLGAGLSRKASQEKNPLKVTKILDESIVAYRNSVQADPKNFLAWNNLGANLNWKAYLEEDHQRAAELRDEAIAACQSATQVDPKYSHAWYSLGLSLVFKANQVGDPQKAAELRDEAMAAYRSAIQADPKNSGAWNNLGNRLGQSANHESDPQKAAELLDETIMAYRSAIQADPQFSGAWNNLGVSLNRKASLEKDPKKIAELRDEAIAACRSATQANSKDSYAWIDLGVILDQKADQVDDPQKAAELRDEAVTAYRSATQADPENGGTWNNLGVHLERKAGQVDDPQKAAELRDEAMTAYRSAIQADPKNGNAWHNLGFNLDRKALQENNSKREAELRDEAMAAYRSAIQADPKNGNAWHNLGINLVRKALQESNFKKEAELRDEAMTAYRGAIQADPENGKAWDSLGTSLDWKALREDNPQNAAELRDEALAAFRSAIQADPKNSTAWYNLGISLDRKAEHESDPQKADMMRDEMIEAFRNATQEEPSNSNAWNNLGVCLSWNAEQESDPHKANQLRDEAIEALRRATQEDPSHSEAWANLSVLLLEGGNAEKSRRMLQDGLEAGRNAALLGAGRYNLACGLALNGEETEAVAELAGCLERREISPAQIVQDLAWEYLRTDPRFQSILESAASESEESPPDATV